MEQLMRVEGQLRVKIVGIGGAGLSALEHMAGTDLGALPLSVIHTHNRVLQSSVPSKLLAGVNRTHGLGSGGDPEIARAMAESEAGGFRQICGETDLIFLVAGMGGGTGTGLAPVFARVAKESGALVIAIVTTPFDFEGLRRMKQAHAGVQNLRAVADAVISIPNQKLARFLDAKTTIVEAFSRTNELLASGVRGIYKMLTRPGLINVDFAYLCSVLRGRHVESALATAEARCENRAREIIEQILANPFLDEGQGLSSADQVLVSLAGGHDLTLAEINRIMEQLNRRVENGQLIFGTSIDPEMTGQISMTLIASRGGKAPVPLNTETSEVQPRHAGAHQPLTDSAFIEDSATPRPPSRFAAPPPASTPENARMLMERQPKARKNGKWTQELLALEIVSRGRFEKSEPTIHRGADLDVPTYIRRGVPLN